MADDQTGPGGQVDDQGRPEGPVEQAVEKHKQKQLAIAGVVLGVIGVAIVIIMRNRSAAASGAAGAATTYSYPSVSPSSMDTGAGGSVDLSSLQSALESLAQSEATLAEQFQSGTSGGTTTTTQPGGPNKPVYQTAPPGTKPLPVGRKELPLYQPIGSAQQGSFLAASGYDTFVKEGTNYVEVAQGTHRLPNYSSIPKGTTTLYYNPSQKV